MMPMKHFNPPPVASATGEENQHSISGLSNFFGTLQSVISYQRIDTLQPFSPANMPAPATSPPTTTASQQQNIISHQPNLCLLHSQPMPNSSHSRTLAKPPIGPFRDHCCKQFKGRFRTTPIFQKQFISSCSKKIPKQEALHCPDGGMEGETGWTDRQTDGWTDGWMDGQTDGSHSMTFATDPSLVASVSGSVPAKHPH